MSQIGIIDYGSGNFASVWNAFDRITDDLHVINAPGDFVNCSHIVLPGVGAFRTCMEKLESMNLIESLHEQVLVKKKQFLGICVGMQVLGSYGTEFEIYDGLGFLDGVVEKLIPSDRTLPLPHMGWNNLCYPTKSQLFREMDDTATFYFVHSYSLKLRDNGTICEYFEYGGKFTAAVSSQNIHGVQFHPEKSQFYGLQVLKNFIALS